MVTKRSIRNVIKETEESLPVPPGFASLTSFTLKRIKSRQTANGIPKSICAPLSNSDIEKFKASFWQRPWILHDQSDCLAQEFNTKQTEVEKECHTDMDSVRRFVGRARSRASSSSASLPESQRPAEGDLDEPHTDDYVPETPGSLHGTHDSSGSTAAHGREHLPLAYVAFDSLRPPETTRSCYVIFQKKMHPTGYKWKYVPDSLKDEYFDEFKKLYTWPADQEAIIKKYWMKTAKSRYSDLVSKVIKKNAATRRPDFIREADWPGWLAYWNMPDVRDKAATNSRNRLSEVAGPGTGPAKHAGGSKSTVSYIEGKMKETGGVQPKLWEINRAYHMQANGQWVSEEFRRIDETVMPLLEAAGGDAVSREEADRIYMEVVGGVKKQRIRGTGSYGSSMASDGRTSAPRSSSYYGPSVDDVVTQRMDAERERMQTQIQAQMQAQLEEERRRIQTQVQTQVQEQIAAERDMMAAERDMMATQLRSQVESQVSSMMRDFMRSMGQQPPHQPPSP